MTLYCDITGVSLSPITFRLWSDGLVHNASTSVIDVAVITAGGDDILIKDLAIGTLSPLAVTRVKSTGTTASKIIYAYS